MPGQNTIPSVCGPLASTPRALKLLLQSTLSQEPWLHDPAVVQLPWRDDLSNLLPDNGGKLTFGIYATDGVVNPLPPIKRAMETVKSLIHSLGHETIEWNPPSHSKAMDLVVCEKAKPLNNV